MQIEVNKNTLAGALVALEKLISRTSPVEAYRSVQIVGKENKLHFRTAGTKESIEFMMETDTLFRMTIYKYVHAQSDFTFSSDNPSKASIKA